MHHRITLTAVVHIRDRKYLNRCPAFLVVSLLSVDCQLSAGMGLKKHWPGIGVGRSARFGGGHVPLRPHPSYAYVRMIPLIHAYITDFKFLFSYEMKHHFCIIATKTNMVKHLRKATVSERP